MPDEEEEAPQENLPVRYATMQSLNIIYETIDKQLDRQFEAQKHQEGKANYALIASTILIGSALTIKVKDLPIANVIHQRLTSFPFYHPFQTSLFYQAYALIPLVALILIYLTVIFLAYNVYKGGTLNRPPNPRALQEIYLILPESQTKSQITANLVESYEDNDEILDYMGNRLRWALRLLLAQFFVYMIWIMVQFTTQ